jgi:very-short-patch-repair endonuclease
MLPRNSKLTVNAKNLRKAMTKEERHLWYDFLRYCKPRFRRQEIIGNYIADFYCHQARLVIELDGSQHCEPESIAYDTNRSQYFESLGIQVIRYYNTDITRNFTGVCEHILSVLNQQALHPSVSFADSSPQGEP